MEQTQDERIPLYFRRTAAGFGLAVCAIGSSSLASWLFGIETLKYYLPGTVTIKFNTALLFLLLGASLCAAALSASRLASLAARVLAGFSALLAGGTAAAYFLGIKNFPLDQLFFREPAGYLYTLTPGRMALETALGLLAASIALLAADCRRAKAVLLREALSGAVFLAGLTVTVGYWFSGHLLVFTSPSRTLISLPAGLAFLLLGAGLLLARPDRGLASLAATATASGRLMRLLVPGTIAIPILIRWARVRGETLGLYGTETGMALMVVSTSAAMAAFLYAAMRQAYAQEREKAAKTAQLERSEEELKRVNTRLAEANKELEAFSYSVSHDLRAPLRGIEGFSKILAEDYGPKLDAEALRVIGVIRHNTLKMAQLIDDMLAFSRVSRSTVNKEKVDMAELAREAWRDAAPAEKAGLCSVPALPPAAGDSAMLRRSGATCSRTPLNSRQKPRSPGSR